MRMALSHFSAAVLFALFTSVVLGVVTRKVVVTEDGDKLVKDATDRDRVLYAARCFGYFLAALIGLAWLMYLGHR